MISRRVFLRNGGLALVSLGFAPSFLARTAAASPARKKLLIAIFQRGAVDGLNVVVPYGERDYYRRRPTIAIPRPGDGVEGALDLDGFFGVPSAARAAGAALQERHARRRARLRLARQHALALRRAGLHGIGHAWREEHRRRVAEPDLAGASAPETRRRFARWRLLRRFRDRCRAPLLRWRSGRSDSSASTTARAARCSARRSKRNTPQRPTPS